MNNQERIKKIISESLKKQTAQQKEFYIFDKLFYLEVPFASEVDIQTVINLIESKIPAEIFNEIDTIMVGIFDFLEERELEALYKDGAIYISNSLSTSRDLLENILHETAHSLENALGHFIYGDYRLMREFLGKRDALERMLNSHGYQTQDLNFKEVEYDKELDDFLYKEVGYPKLQSLTFGLISNPYAFTSLREYWASGFENYILGTKENLKDISPQLFNKIEGVFTYDD
tara:strand:+ start:5122 stop:5814 length:693 start_codon:yes stop_codon:yes gene_type:complete